MELRNKTDQFFREKLDQIEFQPSDQAWNKVQGAIGKKSAAPWLNYMKIAAGFALILTFGLLFYPQETDKNYSFGEVVSPQPMGIASINIPDLERQQVKTTQPKTEIATSNVTAFVKTTDQPGLTVKSTKRKPMELATIRDIRIADNNISVKKPKLKDEAEDESVKITYYTARNNAEENEGELQLQAEDSVKTNLIDKMRFFARSVSPVDLITDLRIAKEELFESGLRKN